MQSLPLADWPLTLAHDWQEACRPALRLRKGGRAASLKPVTRNDYARHLGYLLDFVQQQRSLAGVRQPSDFLTPACIEKYLACARRSWGSVTLYHNLYKLRRASEILQPDLNLPWLKEIEADLKASMQPRDQSSRLATADRIVRAGLRLAADAEKRLNVKPLERARLVRNGLMIALLALCPLRMKNYTSLTVGLNIRKEADRWWIRIPAAETKTKRPDTRRVPKLLNPLLERYLTTYRPILMRSAQPADLMTVSGPFWVSRDGEPLSYSAVEVAIQETTREELGIAINPHAFRKAAATTAAHHVPDMPFLGSALLQHTDPRVTDEHYILVSTLDVTRKYAALVRMLAETD